MGRDKRNKIIIPAPIKRDPNALNAKSRKSSGPFKKNFKREKQKAIQKADQTEQQEND